MSDWLGVTPSATQIDRTSVQGPVALTQMPDSAKSQADWAAYQMGNSPDYRGQTFGAPTTRTSQPDLPQQQNNDSNNVRVSQPDLPQRDNSGPAVSISQPDMGGASLWGSSPTEGMQQGGPAVSISQPDMGGASLWGSSPTEGMQQAGGGVGQISNSSGNENWLVHFLRGLFGG